MKTNAPGKFDCEVYLKAWQLDIRGEDVMRHIDHCWWCHPLIHGSPEEFPLSIEEEAELRLTARRRTRRRRFLLQCAASVVGLTAVGWSIKAAFTPSTPLEASKEKQRKILDELHSQVGDVGIVNHFDNAGAQERIRVINWIATEQRTSLYGLPVRALGDSDHDVRKVALFRLLKANPADLQPHLSDIESAHDAWPDPGAQNLLQRLIAEIEDS